MEPIPDYETVEIIEKCANRIRKKIPLFTYSLIYCRTKNTHSTHCKTLECAFKLAKQFPRLTFGYDLLVDEEKNPTNQYNQKDILIVNYNDLKIKHGSQVHFVFHAGESHDDLNMNIMDSMLLGTKRIGHGNLLFK